MSQFRVELTRFLARRAIPLLMLLGLLIIVWMTVDTTWTTRGSSETVVAGAKESAAAAQAQIDQEWRACLDDPATLRPEATAADCHREVVNYRDYLTRAPLDLREELRDTGQVAALTLAVLAFVIGATFAGADWGSRAMRTQVIAVPRRSRLWLAKALAVATGTGVAAVIGLGLMWATYLITASARDLDFPGFGSMLTWWLVRAVVLVIGAGLGGFALAMILRSTMVTVALLAVYAVVGEALVATLPVSRVASFSPASNVIAWLRDGVRVFDPTVHCPVTSTTCTKTYELTLASGALYLGLLLGAALVVSLLTFRRRDVP